MHHARRYVTFTICVAVLTLLSGCAVMDSPGSGRAAEAPTYRVGDRWVYSAQDGFRSLERWEETHVVGPIAADGISVRITQKGPSRDVARTELLAAPGLVKVGALFDNETRRFATPLERYRFPLAEGQRWSRFVRNFNETTGTSGEINHFVHVRGWETVVTPAGTFDAVVMQVIIRLDDEEFWRFGTVCNYIVWYAPAVRGVVREERRAEYQEKGGDFDNGARIRTQNAVYELLSFSPGS